MKSGDILKYYISNTLLESTFMKDKEYILRSISNYLQQKDIANPILLDKPVYTEYDLNEYEEKLKNIYKITRTDCKSLDAICFTFERL